MMRSRFAAASLLRIYDRVIWPAHLAHGLWEEAQRLSPETVNARRALVSLGYQVADERQSRANPFDPVRGVC